MTLCNNVRHHPLKVDFKASLRIVREPALSLCVIKGVSDFVLHANTHLYYSTAKLTSSGPLTSLSNPKQRRDTSISPFLWVSLFTLGGVAVKVDCGVSSMVTNAGLV
jgi:hypothetical protein